MPTAVKMTRYKSDHESGVVAYHTDENSITVQFQDDSVYLYDHQKPGAAHVKEMKLLAKEGAGLSTYISQHVRENYKRKWQDSIRL
jgi:hypothetical protein